MGLYCFENIEDQKLIDDLLDTMHESASDFTNTFRKLSDFTNSNSKNNEFNVSGTESI